MNFDNLRAFMTLLESRQRLFRIQTPVLLLIRFIPA